MRKFFLSSSIALLFAISFTGCTPQSATDADAGSATTAASAVQFANAKCPIMGGKPTAELIAQYDGQTIGFCCEGCPEKWAALSPEEQAEKFAAVRVEHDDHAGHDHGDHDHAGESHGDHSHADEPSDGKSGE